MTSGTTFFSRSYSEARRRFQEAAARQGAVLSEYRVVPDSAEPLCIDVAHLGDPSAPQALVVSSGVHGVEGFFGSAVQLAWLEGLAEQPLPAGRQTILIHAVNPVGMAHLRRFNEDNVDLNRNFHEGSAGYQGAPAGYADLDGLLNPPSPPSPWEPFRLKAIWNILRHGLPALKNAVAGGQYEFPRGLFFGGHSQSASTRIIQAEIAGWLGGADRIIHIDLHTGLGPFATYKLLLAEDDGSPRYPWYQQTFGPEHIEPFAAADKTAYATNGSLGSWLLGRFPALDYRFAVAEFGTYDVIRVLASLRAENRAHFYADPDSQTAKSAKLKLLDTFVPHDPDWRNQVVKAGLNILTQAQLGLAQAED